MPFNNSNKVDSASRSSSQQSVKSKLPSRATIVPKSSSKSAEKLSSTATTKTFSYGRISSSRSEVTSSSKRVSVGKESISSVAENKTKNFLSKSNIQSRRSSFNPKPNTTTSISPNITRRSSLPDQRDSIDQSKSKDVLKGQHDNRSANDHRAKAVNIAPTQAKTTGIVGQSKGPSLQIQTKNTNIPKSQKQDSDVVGSQKSIKVNERPVINIQDVKPNLQNRTKLQSHSQNSLPQGRFSTSSSWQVPRNCLPTASKLSYKIPSGSSSIKNEIRGKFKKDSVTQSLQIKNEQTLNEKDLPSANISNETSSLANTLPISENSTEELAEGSSHEEFPEVTSENSIDDIATDLSTDQQSVSHMDCKSSMSVKLLTHHEKNDETHKKSFDNIKNSSPILEKINVDPLSYDVSVISQNLDENKTLSEDQYCKEFSRKESKVIKEFHEVIEANMKMLLQIQEEILNILSQARQYPPETYSKIEQDLILLCSEMKKENMKLKSSLVEQTIEELKRFMSKAIVEVFQSLKNGDKESFPAEGLGAISLEKINDPCDIFTKRKEMPQEFENIDEERPKTGEILESTPLQKKIANELNLSSDKLKEQTSSQGDTPKELLDNKIVIEESKRSIERESKKLAEGEGETEESTIFNKDLGRAVGSKKPVNGKVVEPKDFEAEEFSKNEVEVKASKKPHLQIISLVSPPQSEESSYMLSLEKGKEAVDMPCLPNLEGMSILDYAKKYLVKSDSQGKEKAVDMSYLPNYDVTEMPFFENLKKSIENSLRGEKNVSEISLQNKKRVIERFSSLQNKKEVVEVSILPNNKIVAEITSQNENDIQLPLENETEYVDMSYLPKHDVEMSFLRDVEAAVRKNLQNNEKDAEKSLQNVNAIGLQNERATEMSSLQIEKETDGISHLKNGKGHVEISLQNDEKEVFEQSSLYDREAVKISLNEKETVGIEYLNEKDTNENYFLKLNGKTISVPENKTEIKSMLDENIDKDIVGGASNMKDYVDVEVEKTLHQPSVQKKTFRTQKTEDTSSHPNKEEILGESNMNQKISADELKLPEKEEDSGQSTKTPEKHYVTDIETLTNALNALVEETID